MSYNDIQTHMINKFGTNEQVEKLDNVPNAEKLKTLQDNKIYKTTLTAVAVDIIKFTELNMYSDPEVLSKVISEFTWGVTKIMKEYGGGQIDIQGDGIFCIMESSSSKADIDRAFAMACELNTFRKHLIKNIKKYFPGKLKISNFNAFYASSDVNFDFGIGLYDSFENYISKVGHSSTRELVFMGETVNGANNLAKTAGRNGRKHIMMNNLFYTNFTDQKKQHINSSGSFSSLNMFNPSIKVWECDWIMSSYNSFVDNNV